MSRVKYSVEDLLKKFDNQYKALVAIFKEIKRLSDEYREKHDKVPDDIIEKAVENILKEKVKIEDIKE